MKVLVLLLAACLAGCGATGKIAPQAPLLTFVNKTILPDSQLASYWQQAQSDIANGFYLSNAFSVQAHAAQPTNGAIDARALSVNPPVGMIVETDFDNNGEWFYCGQSSEGQTYQATGCTTWPSPFIVKYAANYPYPNLKYEFTTVILIELGYDVSQRYVTR